MTVPKYHIKQQIVVGSEERATMGWIVSAEFMDGEWRYGYKTEDSASAINYCSPHEVLYYQNSEGKWRTANATGQRAFVV